MKIYEILHLVHPALKLLQEACIKVNDVKYIALYDEYVQLLDAGVKASGAVYVLADKYKVSERKVWYIIKRFERNCRIGAVG